MKKSLRSCLEQSSSNWHYIVIALIILAVALVEKILFLALIGYIYFLFKRVKLTKLLILVLVFFLITLFWQYQNFNQGETKICTNALVIDSGDYYALVLKGLKTYYILTDTKLMAGQVVNFEAYKVAISDSSYAGDFSEKFYLLGLGVQGKYETENLEVVKTYWSFAQLRRAIIEFYQVRIPEPMFAFFKTLVLGVNDLESKTIEDFSRLNILHVLVLSGFHVQLLYNFCQKIFFKITKRYYLSANLSLVFILFYSLICGLTPSLLRAVVSLLLIKINERYQLFTKLDIYALSFLIVIIRPTKIYGLGFILGQLASFLLLYMQEFTNTDNKLKKNFITGIYFLLVTLPFLSNVNNSLSLLALFSFLLLDFFTYFWIPLAFALVVLPNFGYLFSPLISSFNLGIDFLSSKGIIIIPYMGCYLKIFYYSLLFLLLQKIAIKKVLTKYLLLLVIFLSLFLNKGVFWRDEVVFLDVGQGDATYCVSDKKGFLIDCYGAYDYLVKKGVTSLEAIFITHTDKDHVGDLVAICKTIAVKQVFINAYEEKILEIPSEMQQFLRAGTTLKIGECEIKVVSPAKDYQDKNANSLVLFFQHLGYSFLLMGDATKEVENEILQDYTFSKVDFLKVGHHGSNTSSSVEFLAKLKPKYTIVSVGKNNYGLPAQEVLERLKYYSKPLITIETGSITINSNGIELYKLVNT